MIWFLFLLLIFFFLFLDLGVFHKKNTEISTKESLTWTAVWIILAIGFGGVIFLIYQHNLFEINSHGADPYDAMIKYLTGYVIEKSLSLDNIFVIAIIFSYFKIESKYQHNILFWGVLGAIVFRGLMILLGTSIIERFSWSTYIFGAILVYSAVSMLSSNQEEVDHSKNPALRLLSKFVPIKWDVRSSKYFIKENGKTFATLTMATLMVVEFTDVIFAVDSIPAIFAVTTDPFLVFTSNIFAILGLRNLYFFLANILDKFKYIKYSLVFILIFVGIKMGLTHHYHIPSVISLSVILGSLVVGVVASLMINNPEEQAAIVEEEKELEKSI